MQYMIFQYGQEPVLIQRIFISFKAILEKDFRSVIVLENKNKDDNIQPWVSNLQYYY